MAKKCLACDLVYAGELLECPSCGKVDHLAVLDPGVPAGDPALDVTRCGALLVGNGLLVLAVLLRPQLGLVSLAMGLLLLVRNERAVPWVKAVMLLKLAVVVVVFLVAPRLVWLLSMIESLAVFALLDKAPVRQRLGTIAFTVLLLAGVLSALLPSLPLVGNL